MKNLAYSVTQDELHGVFEDAVEVRLVSKDGNSKGYVTLQKTDIYFLFLCNKIGAAFLFKSLKGIPPL